MGMSTASLNLEVVADVRPSLNLGGRPLGHWIRARGYYVDPHDGLALATIEATADLCDDYEILLDYLFDSEDNLRSNTTAWSEFVLACRLSGLTRDPAKVYGIVRRACRTHGAAGVRDNWARVVEYVACLGT